MTREILIELDERRRASLGRIGRPEHTRYMAHTRDDGTIVMRPVDVVPAVVGSKPATLAAADATTEREPAGTVDAIAEMAAAFNRHLGRVVESAFREPPRADDGTTW